MLLKFKTSVNIKMLLLIHANCTASSLLKVLSMSLGNLPSLLSYSFSSKHAGPGAFLPPNDFKTSISSFLKIETLDFLCG